MLDALVDRQYREIAASREPARVEKHLHIAHNCRTPISLSYHPVD
jgi:hypothetical protein